MARVVGIGYQDFSELITSGCFYVDKTDFIREWWENQDVATLITRLRRFGKTLNMSMLERFYSIEYEGQGQEEYELTLTNKEVRIMFKKMIRDWFGQSARAYNGFIKALLQDNKKEMNAYMNQIALTTFSYFDSGKHPSGSEPERFYHGFVLGLMVELADRYVITSNRESGFGRYDVMLKPRANKDNAIILEFKVYDPEDEKSLQDTVKAALEQIETMNYKAALMAEGIGEDRIRKYGFAFEGKRVLIGSL